MARPPLKVALLQETDHGSREANLDAIEAGLREAAAAGAALVLLQELHNGPYFCQREAVEVFDQAETIPGPGTERLGALAQELGIVIVASLFERRAAGLYHNTAVVFDCSAAIAGVYRKMHIPDDPGFYEKFYFTPGDLGFEPIDTSVGRLGVLVCWDQWYPEAARLMALAGAELLLYPTAIGWDPADAQAEKDRQRDAWITVQRGHAVASKPTRRATAAACSSGDRALSPGHKASFWRKPAPTRANCCWPISTLAAASRCGASGRSCATGASTPMATCCGATAIDTGARAPSFSPFSLPSLLLARRAHESSRP